MVVPPDAEDPHDRIFIRLDKTPERDGQTMRRADGSCYHSGLHCEQCGRAVKTIYHVGVQNRLCDISRLQRAVALRRQVAVAGAHYVIGQLGHVTVSLSGHVTRRVSRLRFIRLHGWRRVVTGNVRRLCLDLV